MSILLSFITTPIYSFSHHVIEIKIPTSSNTILLNDTTKCVNLHFVHICIVYRVTCEFSHLLLLNQLPSFCLPWHHLNHPEDAFLVCSFLSTINYFHSLVLTKEHYCHRKQKKFLILLKSHQLNLKNRLFSPN